MWKPAVIASLLLILLLWRACPQPGAESAFKVKGKILMSSGRAPEGCTVKLFKQPNQRLIRESEIPAEFEKSFVIEPAQREYFLLFTCRGAEKPFKTQVYKLGDVKHYLEPIDLGTIELTDAREPGDQASKPPESSE